MKILMWALRRRRRPSSRSIITVTGAGNALRRVVDQLGDSVLRPLVGAFGPIMNSLPIIGLVLSALGFLAMPFVGAGMVPVMTAIMAAALFGLTVTDQPSMALLFGSVTILMAVSADRATARAIRELRERPADSKGRSPARRVELATTWWCAPALLGFGAATWLLDWRTAVRGLACAALVVAVLVWCFVPRAPRRPFKAAALSLRRALEDVDLQLFQLLNAGTKGALRCVGATAPLLLLDVWHDYGWMAAIVAVTETVGLAASAALQHPWQRHVVERKRKRVQTYLPDLLVGLGAALVLVALGRPGWAVTALCVSAGLLSHIARTTNNVATQVRVGHVDELHLILGRQAVHGIWRILANGVYAIVLWLVAPTQSSGPTRAVLWLAGLAVAVTVLTMLGRLLTAHRDTSTKS